MAILHIVGRRAEIIPPGNLFEHGRETFISTEAGFAKRFKRENPIPDFLYPSGSELNFRHGDTIVAIHASRMNDGTPLVRPK